jgi:hypothetical protein
MIMTPTVARSPLDTTAQRSSPSSRRRRAPWTVHLAAVPLTLMCLVSGAGASYFSFHTDPVRPPQAPAPGSWQAVVLLSILLGYFLTAIASVPGVYRRSRTAWTVALGFLAAHLLFGALKLFGLGEGAAVLFLAVDLVVVAALLAPATQRHVRGD